MKGIADTGFLVAFANRNDMHHLWAVNLASQILEPLLTCEAVLAETAFHLQDVSAILKMIRFSELNPRHLVITIDRKDFSNYRRNKREIIPLICPPQG